VHVLSSLMGVCAWNARHNLHLWRKSKRRQALGQRLPLQQLQTPTCPRLSPRVLLLHSRRCVYVCVYIHFTITGAGARVCIYTSQSQCVCVLVCIYFTITGACVRVCIYIHMCEYMCITMCSRVSIYKHMCEHMCITACPCLSPEVLRFTVARLCVCECVYIHVYERMSIPTYPHFASRVLLLRNHRSHIYVRTYTNTLAHHTHTHGTCNAHTHIICVVFSSFASSLAALHSQVHVCTCMCVNVRVYMRAGGWVDGFVNLLFQCVCACGSSSLALSLAVMH